VDDIARGTVLAGQLFGGKLAQQKPETGNLKPESSEPPQVSGLRSQVSESRSQVSASSSGLRSQVSGFSGGRQPAFDIINLGGGNNPISLQTMIKWIEKALGEKQGAGSLELRASESRVSDPKSGKSSGFRSQVSGFSARSQVSAKAKIISKPASPADMKATWADITKAKRLLNWQPEVSPEEGFKRTVEWHIENRNWLKRIKL
jgi:hypothetical protein